jgi:hypothetical protein
MRCSRMQGGRRQLLKSMHNGATEAASWILAADLMARVGVAGKLYELHPGDGQYDVLAIAPTGELANVYLNRAGSIQVGEQPNERVVAGYEKWHELCSGESSLGSLADEIAALVGIDADPPSGDEATIYGVIAEVMRLSALHRLGWRCCWGYWDSSGTGGSQPRSELFAPYRDQLEEFVSWHRVEVSGNQVRNYWFIVDAADAPVACFDVDGYVHRPGHLSVEVATNFAGVPDWGIANALLGGQIGAAVAAEPATTPGLGISAVLGAFNRKERFHLLAAATSGLSSRELDGASMRLKDPFRRQLEAVTGWAVPAHAWVAMDYHLSWLHAALQWIGGTAWPGQIPPYPQTLAMDGSAWVTGTQEDVDLIVSWTAHGRPHLLLVEAKGYGAWNTAQLASKITRSQAIVTAAEESGEEVEVRFVLTSPRKSKKVEVTAWPAWAMTSDGTQPIWMPLGVPGGRLATQRVNQEGEPSAAGTVWRITGPTS